MPKRNPVKTLRNKCDKMLQTTFMESSPRCEGCGKPAVCAHHYFTKSTAASLRYDFSNLVAVCQGCHLRHHNGDPRLHAGVIERRGIDWHKALELKKNTTIVKPSIKYYNEVYLKLCQTKL